jgi:hypothetical protein
LYSDIFDGKIAMTVNKTRAETGDWITFKYYAFVGL